MAEKEKKNRPITIIPVDSFTMGPFFSPRFVEMSTSVQRANETNRKTKRSHTNHNHRKRDREKENHLPFTTEWKCIGFQKM